MGFVMVLDVIAFPMMLKLKQLSFNHQWKWISLLLVIAIDQIKIVETICNNIVYYFVHGRISLGDFITSLTMLEELLYPQLQPTKLSLLLETNK